MEAKSTKKDEKKQTQSKSSRNFLLTLNEPDETYEKIKNYLFGLKSMNYFISTLEKAPTTGHKHIHIYIQCETPIRLSIKKLLGAHIDKCYGSPQQNVDYIHKVKEPEKRGVIIDEWGELKQSGGYRISDVKKMTKEERNDLNINYFNIVEKMNANEANELTIDDLECKKVKVWYISGESGYGKTAIAKTYIKRYMLEHDIPKWNKVKREGEFWHGTSDGAKIALYDDFRDSHMKPSEFINFVDYNVHDMNIKGGTFKNTYELILITSTQDLMSIYYDYCQKNQDEPQKQWLRRIKEIKLYEEVKKEQYEDFVDKNFN